jgi:hypothetical protein
MTTTKELPRRPSDGIDGGGLSDGPDALPCGHAGPSVDDECPHCAAAAAEEGLTTVETLTDEQINALGIEAATAGDAKMTQLCTIAIIGIGAVRDEARSACLRAINYAETQAADAGEAK